MPVWRICLIVVLRLDGQFNFSSLPPSHRIACGEIVVEEVEKKQCWKCKGHKALEMFRGDNATCNGCLAHRKKWAEKVRELSRKYGEEYKEEKKPYNQE